MIIIHYLCCLKYLKGGEIMGKQILNFESVNYSNTNTLSACVTGGGGCSCDDGTSE